MASHLRSRTRPREVAQTLASDPGRSNRVVEPEPEAPGWFGRATDWVGRQAGEAWDAVSDWGRDVAETAGDVRDVIAGSDLDLDDGVWSGETDVEEVADLLPGPWAAAVRANRDDDRDARVQMRWDTHADAATVALEDVVLDGLSVAGVETGPVRLQGLRLDVEGVSRTSARADLVGDLTRDPFGRLWRGDDDDDTGPVRVRVAVASAEARDVRLADEGLTAARLALTDLSVLVVSEDGLAFTPDAAVISVEVGTADVSGLSIDGTRVDDLGVQGASAVLSGDDVTTRARAATVSGLSVSGPSGEGLGLAEGTATDLRATADGGRLVAAGAEGLTARELAVSRDDASASLGDLALDGVSFDGAALRAASGVASEARLAQGDARATVGGLTAADLRVGASGGGAGRLDVREVTAGAGDAALVVQSGVAEDLAVTADGGAARRVALEGVSANHDQAFVDARALGASGVSVDASGGVAAADRLTASGLLADVDRQRIGVDALQVDGVAGRLGETAEASADRVQAVGVGLDVALPASGGGGLPTETLLDLADRVDDADLVGQVALQPGEVGPARVQPGTVASVRGMVRDGAIVPGDRTGATFSRSLSAGPLGIAGVSGVETRGTRDGGFEVRADAGFFGRHTVSGERPLSRDLSSLAAEALAPPATGAGEGLSLADAVDLDRSALSARATLDGGTVRLPSGSVTLADRERAGDQTVDLAVEGQDRIVAAFVRLLVSGFALETATARVEGGAGTVRDASLRVEAGRASGGVGRIDLGPIRGVTR